jgi:hypothetical protein
MLAPNRGERRMRIAMPSMSHSLSYTLVAAVALTLLAALVLAIGAAGNLVAAVLVLAIAAAIHRLIGRHLVMIVSAREAAAIFGLLLLLCALADLAGGYPYQAIVFLVAAAALGFAFVLLHQGTEPAELRMGRIIAVAAPSSRAHLRMLEELRDAGILTPDEFAAKLPLLGL